MFAVETLDVFWSCPFCHQVPLNPRSNPRGNSSSDCVIHVLQRQADTVKD